MTNILALWEDDALMEVVRAPIWLHNEKTRQVAIDLLRALSQHFVRRPAWPDDVAPRPLRVTGSKIWDVNGRTIADCFMALKPPPCALR